ncbi:MAG: hypothetical protein IJP49_11925 [Bacteroidales bacterium]|nr:hypothetical protein [Bacteroidales bacterium]
MCTVCYIPMLEGQSGEVERWAAEASVRLGIPVVMLPQADWNNDLTPWPAGPIFRKGKSFGGGARAYLQLLENQILPEIEGRLGLVDPERWLIGISLSGLFAVWAAFETHTFTRIASISGSFWYEGFPEWLATRPGTGTLKSAYLSLGDTEADTRNPHLKSIADDTEAVVRLLSEKGISTVFEWNDGSHFAPVVPRLEKALAGLLGLAR